MKIDSLDRKSWIEIESSKDGFNHKNLTIETSVDICHGVFRAKNLDINFLNIKEFITKLENFLIDRKEAPILNGTYDSFIKIYGDTSHVFLKFAIGDEFCGKPNHDYLFRGSFEFDQEQLLSIKQGIQQIQDL